MIRISVTADHATLMHTDNVGTSIEIKTIKFVDEIRKLRSHFKLGAKFVIRDKGILSDGRTFHLDGDMYILCKTLHNQFLDLAKRELKYVND